MEKIKIVFFTIIFIVFSKFSISQNDYIVTIKGDSIGGIKITNFPKEVVPNKEDHTKGTSMEKRDMKISYKMLDNKEKEILYHLVDHYSVGGIVYKTWHCQELPYTNNIITFVKVIEIPGSSSEQLYKKARNWIINYFKISDANLTAMLSENYENGSIVMFSACSFPEKRTSESKFYVYYKVDIKVKDGKARIELSNFWYHFEVYNSLIQTDYKYEKNEETAEAFVEKMYDKSQPLYVNKNGINYFYYIGRLLIARTANDLVIPDFERTMTSENRW